MVKANPLFKAKHGHSDRWNVNISIPKLKWQQSGTSTMLVEGICVPVGFSVSALKADGCCDVNRQGKTGEVEPLLQFLVMFQDVMQISKRKV